MKTKHDTVINISCTWGDGPDVCVNIKYSDWKLMERWFKAKLMPLDLTGDEAIEMGNLLIDAGKQAKELDDKYKEYVENENA